MPDHYLLISVSSDGEIKIWALSQTTHELIGLVINFYIIKIFKTFKHLSLYYIIDMYNLLVSCTNSSENSGYFELKFLLPYQSVLILYDFIFILMPY